MPAPDPAATSTAEPTEKVNGPYDRGYGEKRWRIVRIVGGKQKAESFATEREALKAIKDYRWNCKDRLLGDAAKEFLKQQDVKATTRKTNEYRLLAILGLSDGRDRPLTNVTESAARQMYTVRAADTSPDTHHAELFLAQAFGAWCVTQRYLRSNPFEAVERTGKKRRGAKEQLRVDEAIKFLSACLGEGSVEGLACATALLEGMRATEVTSRVVRDVDAGGSLLWIPCSKTPAGRRTMGVPAVLAVRLAALAKGAGAEPRKRDEQLFGDVDRHWLAYHVRRFCGVAKVPEVSPHGLRGLHTTLAVVQRVAADAVATALGQTGPDVTRAHYIAPGTEQNVAAATVAEWIVPQGMGYDSGNGDK